MQPLALLALSASLIGLAGAAQVRARPTARVEAIIFVRELGLRGESHLRMSSPAGGTTQRMGPSAFGVGSPAISRDGRRIAFVSLIAGSPRIYVRRLTGGPARVVATGGDALAPAWSPDGRRLAYVNIAYTNGLTGDNSVYVMTRDGSRRRLVSEEPGVANDPAWSPDGKRIAFANDINESSELYVVDLDGTHRRRLTTNNVADTEPTWAVIRR